MQILAITFIEQNRLWLLLGVAALAISYLILQRRRSTYAVRFTNLALLDSVAPKRPGWRRHLPAALLLLALGGMVGLRTFFWLLWFIRSAGMGFGDVRLAAIVGLVLGWEGLDALVVGAWIGFVSFALPGVALAGLMLLRAAATYDDDRRAVERQERVETQP